MDLGRKMKSPGTVPASPVDAEEPKITYPGFCLSDKVAEEFTKEQEPKLGDEYAATVLLRVTSLASDEYGQRVQFDIKELDDVAEESADSDEKSSDESDDSDEAEVKTLGYKRKKTEKEAPDMSAKTLED
jgi:hypothetical protein